MKVEHELKCSGEYFNRISIGQKTFEIRKNDRDYQVGDILVLKEFDAEKGEYIDYSSPIRADIVYMTNYGQKDNYVVLGIVPIREGTV